MAAGRSVLAWTSFGLLLPVALLGVVMPARWIPVHREDATAGQPAAATSPGAATGPETATGPGADGTVPAERHFPLAVVLVHGLFAVVTLVLVLLTALGIGGD
ncbi:hypothetical protein ABZ719_37210 [Streptomyces sp. NPDC006743]|uniref:hypothetical protein n=1 Tax=Streptomyces sp. NPDC006743 TaxID=3154480 RepID=UPI00345671CD